METACAEDRLTLLLTAFVGGEPAERLAALADLKFLGPAAEKAIPALIPALQDPDLAVRPAAAAALAAMGAVAVRPVVEAMLGPDPDQRRALLLVLGSIGPAAAEARAVIEAACRDPELGRLAEGVRRRVCPTWKDRWRRPLRTAGVWGMWVGLVALSAAALAALVRLGGEVWPETSRAVVTISFALGTVGAATGGLSGGSRWGARGALIGALVFGVSAGYVGYVAGRLTDGVVRPLVESIGRP